ncbi:MAG: glycerophosphodiester phosphodiesterase [Planctomycetaceae bacterium]|nr:glycerophosphodiester phosphodiesterase [Planctomycetaceae bacterium]
MLISQAMIPLTLFFSAFLLASAGLNAAADEPGRRAVSGRRTGKVATADSDATPAAEARAVGATGIQNTPIVIAHRGASGYLPEHTLESAALAHGMNVDYIEQDVVLSRDNVPLVLHDVTLNDVTDVAVRFPDRRRANGLWYVMDFDLAELKSLTVTERRSEKRAWKDAGTRFPLEKGAFRICTLQEQLTLIQGLNQSRQTSIGIYVELKDPDLHHKAGRDIATVVLKVLDDFGYRSAKDPVFLQCFDEKEVRRLRLELDCSLPIIQLLSKAPEPARLQEIAKYADGLGIPLTQVVSGADANGNPAVTDIVRRAHEHAMQVHVWTFRTDAMPAFAPDAETLLNWLVKDGGVDGIFSDQPDVVCRWRNRQQPETASRGPFRLLNQKSVDRPEEPQTDAGDN